MYLNLININITCTILYFDIRMGQDIHKEQNYLHGQLHLGGRVTFSFPHGTVIRVALQKQVICTVNGHGQQGPANTHTQSQSIIVKKTTVLQIYRESIYFFTSVASTCTLVVFTTQKLSTNLLTAWAVSITALLNIPHESQIFTYIY